MNISIFKDNLNYNLNYNHDKENKFNDDIYQELLIQDTYYLLIYLLIYDYIFFCLIFLIKQCYFFSLYLVNYHEHNLL